MAQTEQPRWVEDRPPGGERLDLTIFGGVSALAPGAVPPDLVRHAQSDWVRVQGYYQVDNVARWRAWRDLCDRQGAPERWLFYGCPQSMVEELLSRQEVQPYGAFFPRVFGEQALYLFEQPLPAARAAIRYGLDRAGYLLSCRVASGRVFRTRQGNPEATEPPPGYDAVMVPQGTDLGSGALEGDLYVLYERSPVLIRYVTHFERAG